MKNLNRGVKPAVLLLVICLFLADAAGQKRNYRFHYYTADQGLSQNYIDCILKDSRGYLWFGTRNGLNRFDGYSFHIFEADTGNTNTISNNLVKALCEDNFGNIWIGTGEGLDTYIFSENRFVSLPWDSTDILPIRSVSVNSIVSDHQGRLWVGTDFGVVRLELAGSGGRIRNTRYYNAGQMPGSLSGNIVNCIYEDKQQRIWIGTDEGLNLFEKESESFKTYRNNPDNDLTLSSSEVLTIYQDGHNDLWIGTMTGLNRFNEQNQSFERFFHFPDQESSVAHNVIYTIEEDLDGNILVGTLGGLSIYNRKDNNFFNYTYDINSTNGINNDFINCILADDEGNVWIGTERGGINRINTYQNDFEYFEHQPGNNQSLSHNAVNSIFEDAKYLWIGTAGGGLDRYDKQSGTYTHFRYGPDDPDALNSNFITSIIETFSGKLWVGTWGSGINVLDPESRSGSKFYHYQDLPGNPGSLVNNYVSSIIEDSRSNLWIGTRGGIERFNSETGEFEFVHGDNSGMYVDRVGCLKLDQQGNLWAGTEEGLYKLSWRDPESADPGNCTIDRYLKDEKIQGTISGNYVISIHEDKQGTLWFGTYGNGLNRLVRDPGSGKEKFVSYSRKDGLVNDIIYGILEDADGNLWLSTDNGLSKFNPVTGEFINFSVSDGLLSNQFYWSAAHRNSEGRLYFGGMKGLMAFYPEDIRNREFHNNLRITDFKIYNQSVGIGDEFFERVVLEKPVSETERLVLSHKIREFSFEFSALNYDHTDKIRYAYILDGFDEDWTYVGPERRFVSYTNLKGGEYTLKVNAALAEGNWSNDPLTLHITIIPPIWQRFWAIVLASLLLSLSIIFYNRYRTFTLKQRKKVLEFQVRERTQQIEGQKEQLEMQNLEIIEQRDKLMDLNKKVQQANQHQMRFFTHMSHEFRTPLTLIISPLEEIIDEMEGHGKITTKLQLVKRNAMRLLHLINQLMEVRRIKTGNIGLKVIEMNLVQYLESISQPFRDLARQRNIEFEFSARNKSIVSMVDRDKLEIIFYNLLSNAIKYTPEYGNVRVFITLAEQEKCLKESEDEVTIVRQKEAACEKYISISIADTGIGIEKDQLKDVFKRFFKAPVTAPNYAVGTGIGLYLTKELVKAHRGWLFASSSPGKGSDFRVNIPYGKDYLLDNEIIGEVIETTLKPRNNLTASVLREHYGVVKERSPYSPDPRARMTFLKPLVLIVDDDPELCDYIAGHLSGEFEVMIAEDGEDGLLKAKQYLPELILSDNMMPRLDGYEFCAQVKADLQTSHIPFVLISARYEEENMIEGLEVGADDYIVKPFEMKVLEAKIRTLIENRHKLRKLFSSSLIDDIRKVAATPVDNKFLQKSVRIVEQNLINSEFGVQSLAEELNISRSLLHKKLTAIVGHSANDFILSIRLKHSAKLILEGNKKISEIAYQVGFNDPKYFSRCFKKHFGKTPSEYVRG